MQAMLLSVGGTILSVAIALVAVGVVVLTVALHFVRNKQGKTGCGCGCAGCSGCTACRPKEQKEKENSAPRPGADKDRSSDL